VPRRPPWADCAEAAIGVTAVATTAKTNDAKSVRILLILQREANMNEGSQTCERLGLEGIRRGIVQKWQIVANA